MAQQTVEAVAQNAVKAGHQAQAAATERDSERTQLSQIPLPTKGLYTGIHDPSAWANPFLTAGPDTLTLRILVSGSNPANAARGAAQHPEKARHRETQIRPADLAKAIVAIPAGSWPYGRVIAVAESVTAARRDRPRVRRNVEAAIQQLNDLGIVVEEWPER